MKKHYYLLFLLTFGVQSQESKIEVHGDGNVIKVVQGTNIKEYNLSNQKQNQEFYNFMKGFPGFTKEMRTTLNKNNKLLQKLTENNVIVPTKFLEEFGRLSVQTNKLKEEIQALKKETKDPELSKILDEAKKLLDAFQNEEYQKLLEDFKQKRKAGLQHEMAQVSYLQAQNNRLNLLYDKALEQINEALDYDPANTDFIIEQGNVYYETKQYDLALESFTKVLAIREYVQGKTHPQTVALYNYIGMVYLGKSQNNKALSYFQDAINAFERMPDKGQLLIAISHNNLGMTYAAMDNNELAIEHLQKAMSVYEKNNSENIDAATTYSNIGLIYQDKNDYPCAQEYFLKSLKIKEKILGRENAATANLYNAIGQVYYKLRHYDLALKYCFLATHLLEKEKIADQAKLADLYFTIGDIYYQTDKHTESIDFLNKTAAIQENDLGALHEKRTITYLKIADVYDDVENYKDTYKAALNAFHAEESKKKKDPELLNKTHSYLAMACFEIGTSEKSTLHLQESITYMKKVIAYEEKLKEKDKSTLAGAYVILSIGNFFLSDFKSMTQNMEKCLIYYPENDEVKKSDLQVLLFYSLILDGQYKRADEMLAKSNFDAHIYDTLEICFDFMEEQLMDNKKYKESINAFEYLLGKMEADEDLMPDSKQQFRSYGYLAISYCKIGKPTKAAESFKKAIAYAKHYNEDADQITEDYQNCQTDQK